jgi:signal transduction histidine kinase
VNPVLRAAILILAVPFSLAAETDMIATGQPAWLFVTDIAVGWILVGAGVLAWSRRPESWTGPLLVIAGFSWMVGGFRFGWPPLVETVAILVTGTHLFILPWVVLGFPSGRLTRRVDQAWIALAAVLIYAFNVGFALTWPGGLLAGDSDGSEALALAQLAAIVGYAYAIPFAAYLLYRLGRASSAARRLSLPAYLAYIAYSLVPDENTADLLGVVPPEAHVIWLMHYAAVALVPVTLVIGLISEEPARAAAGRLAAEVGSSSAPSLREALARALGDSSLQVWRTDATGTFVDPDGAPMRGPPAPAGRSVTLVESKGTTLAALVHDPALRAEPEVVAAVVSVARLALENERLQERLAEQLDEVEASRLRIVEATDAERRRIERDLHDGAQQSLVSALLGVRLSRGMLDGDPASAPAADSLDRSARHLEDALRELRELAHGIHPAVLTESGLTAAFESLAERSSVPTTLSVDVPTRLPASVEEAAYFVAAEAMANAAKHARAGALSIDARLEEDRLVLRVADDGAGGARPEGSGMRGMADRVSALGGLMTVSSPVGHGTSIEASLPCGDHSRGALPEVLPT